MNINPNNIQLHCKDRTIFFLSEIKESDFNLIGRPTIIYMGNKCGTIGLDYKMRLKISTKNIISDFSLEYLKLKFEKPLI
jgi:hypothetical protein